MGPSFRSRLATGTVLVAPGIIVGRGFRHEQVSQMTEIILSQWVIASALGALCLGLLFFSLVPAVFLTMRLRSMKGALSAMRADSAGLKQSLVADLRDILERLAERQIEAASQHQMQLGQHLSSALQQPLEDVAQSLQDFGKNQNSQISQGLQDQMSAFAERLDRLLGGQVGQAKELQLQTLKSLENTVVAFEEMTKSIGTTAESATQSMVKQLRASVSRSQAETDANLTELLGKLTAQVSSTVAAIEQQATLTGKVALDQQKKISEQAQRSIEALSNEVRAQTQAIEMASQSMRTAGADVTTAVERIIEGMTGLISGAAQEFMRSGQGFADIFDKSSALSRDLAQTAAALAASSKDIGVVVTDYRNARETLQGMVDLMRATVETARSDASLASDVVDRIEAAAHKLVTAQGQADETLAKLNGVLTDAHSAFSAQMLETVRDFHEHLTRTLPSQQIADESQRRHSEFDRMISDWVQATPRLRHSKPAAPRDKDEERVAARPLVPGNGTE
jgi:hypothetical protein